MALQTRYEQDVWRRRRVLLTLGGTAFCAIFGGTALRAAQGNNTTKGEAWLLGDCLGLAAFLHYQDAAPKFVDPLLDKAKALVDKLGLSIKLKPLPAKGAPSNAAEEYFLADGGAFEVIGGALAEKYDDDHAKLFRVAVGGNFLIADYDPQAKGGVAELQHTIVNSITTQLESIGVPSGLWRDVVRLVNQRRDYDEVKDAVIKMERGIADFYIPNSGAP